MDKQTWIMHMVNSTGLTRPSFGGDIEAWKSATQGHLLAGCQECAARRKTAHRSMVQRQFNDGMRSLGLTRVVGAVSGKVYWE